MPEADGSVPTEQPEMYSDETNVGGMGMVPMLQVTLKLWYCSTCPPTDVDGKDAVPERKLRDAVAP